MAGTQTPGLLSPRGHWQHWQSSALLYSVGSQRQLSTHARRPSARVGTWGPSSPLSRGGLPGSIGGAGQEDGASLGPQFGLPEQPALAWPVLGGTGALHPSCQRLTVHSPVPEACRHALPLQHSSVPWPALDRGRQVVREVSGGQTKVNKARWHLRGHLETPPTAHGTRPCWTLAPSPAVQVWPSRGAGLAPRPALVFAEPCMSFTWHKALRGGGQSTAVPPTISPIQRPGQPLNQPQEMDWEPLRGGGTELKPGPPDLPVEKPRGV